MIYMFLSNNPSSRDINLLNLSCLSSFEWLLKTGFTVPQKGHGLYKLGKYLKNCPWKKDML